MFSTRNIYRHPDPNGSHDRRSSFVARRIALGRTILRTTRGAFAKLVCHALQAGTPYGLRDGIPGELNTINQVTGAAALVTPISTFASLTGFEYLGGRV